MQIYEILVNKNPVSTFAQTGIIGILCPTKERTRRIYKKLSATFTHHVVKHGEGQYVVGDAHTNGIEGFWALFKRGIVGQYHQISERHIDRYIDEFCYRFNNRNNEDIFNITLLKSVSL